MILNKKFTVMLPVKNVTSTYAPLSPIYALTSIRPTAFSTYMGEMMQPKPSNAVIPAHPMDFARTKSYNSQDVNRALQFTGLS
jgi:hypothetical protein